MSAPSGMRSFRCFPTPVSYTHLDVYKRQVPYQFNLLSSVLTSIRTHGASGKHLSGGERSMLALFKESAVNVMNEEAGVIVPFHRFYDALENFLDHSHSGVIIRAYDNSYINPEKKMCIRDSSCGIPQV